MITYDPNDSNRRLKISFSKFYGFLCQFTNHVSNIRLCKYPLVYQPRRFARWKWVSIGKWMSAHLSFSLHYFSFFRCIINTSLSLQRVPSIFANKICFSFKIFQNHPPFYTMFLFCNFPLHRSIFHFKYPSTKIHQRFSTNFEVIFISLWENLVSPLPLSLSSPFSFSALNIIKVTSRFPVKFRSNDYFYCNFSLLFLFHFCFFIPRYKCINIHTMNRKFINFKRFYFSLQFHQSIVFSFFFSLFAFLSIYIYFFSQRRCAPRIFKCVIFFWNIIARQFYFFFFSLLLLFKPSYFNPFFFYFWKNGTVLKQILPSKYFGE